jgi:C-terminal processing protease CtpA/Prc
MKIIYLSIYIFFFFFFFSQLLDTTSRTRPPIKTAGSESSSELNVPYPKFESPKAIHEDLSKYLSILFTDNEGPVQIKHCLLKKDPNYNGYGLLLRYQNGLHLIDQVEEGSPAYNAGLREDDVILYVDKKNVEQMTHDDVKILIRKLSLSNTNIDLILIKKHDVQRYKIYQERNSIDWKPIFQDKLYNEIVQSRQIIYRKKS